MRGPTSEHADFKVFSDPTLFATCYQSYAQTMLPYANAAGAAAAPFTSVTVRPAPEAPPSSTRLHVAAFAITRTGPKVSVVTTAVVVYGGRMQATLDLASTTAFPPATEGSLVSAVEGRLLGNLSP
jgi:hypothetical protein